MLPMLSALQDNVLFVSAMEKYSRYTFDFSQCSNNSGCPVLIFAPEE